MDTRKGSCWSPSDWRDRSGRPGHPLKKKLYNISRTAIHTHIRVCGARWASPRPCGWNAVVQPASRILGLPRETFTSFSWSNDNALP